MTLNELRGWRALMATEAYNRWWRGRAESPLTVENDNVCWCGAGRYRDARLCLEHYEEMLVEWGAPSELLDELEKRRLGE
jgi:hypothetical protein